MKIKELTDLRSKNIQELKRMVHAKKIEAAKKSMDIKLGKEKNLKSTRILRLEIAKILTLVKEKEILEKLGIKEETK